ncbi:MAG: peptide ABC transporter substrate-binding protein [Alicyclobacillus sp.]|nr:peptide ABC transporter substrate-binding protein [Alicyclobacillus sp.]
MAKKLHLGKVALAAATLTGMVTAFAGAASADTGSGSGSFSMYIIGDKRGFDPDIFTWAMYSDSMGIFEGLVHNSSKGPVPGIATKWTTSKDGLTWTFYLRPNAKFSNGDPVTAQDFVFGFQRAFDPTTAVRDGGGSVNTAVIPILNGPEVFAGTKLPKTLGVKALDDHTLQIKLYRKDPNLIRDLALPQQGWAVPLDPKVVQSMYAKDWANPAKIVSDGPYMVKSFTPNTSATLVPNPYYYGKVNLKQITLVYTAGTTGLIDFKNGVLDVAVLQPADIQAVENDPSLKSQLHFFPTAVQYSLDVAPSADRTLMNPLVRKALMMAIDRDTICKSVLQGTGTPAYDYQTPTWLDPWIKKGAIPYDPTQARKLLAQAGFPNGKNFPTVTINVGVSGTPDIVAQAIQQMWEQNLHIKVNYNGMPYSQFSGNYNQPIQSGVGFRQNSSNMSYPQLALPQSVEQFVNTGLGQDWLAPYLPFEQFQQWNQINSNQSLSPDVKKKKEAQIMVKYLPKELLNWVKLGVKAYQTNNTKLMQQWFLQQEENVYDIPVYTPLQPVLIRSNIKGYAADSFLLTAPPKWFNDITVS